MPKIIELDQHVADLIAAGEVVERPASVVKELMENSIDAGAGIITIEIQAGGMPYIRVTDNGCGIAPDDVSTAFLRHATSKLRNAEGLESIGTLGFRGEALAAIAAVSRIDILTRESGADEGVSMSQTAGVASEVSPAGCPEGTTIIVRDLFFNTPARLKFMKSDRAEGSAVASTILRTALSRPDVSFRFIKDGKTEYHSPGDSQAESCIYSLLGRDFFAGLVPAESSDESMSVTGFVSSVSAVRGNRAYQFFFVNGRPIQSRTLQAALEQAYANSIPSGRYPACVFYITTGLGAVDVNVHPAKTEVKFISDKQVFDAVYYATLGAVKAHREVREGSVGAGGAGGAGAGGAGAGGGFHASSGRESLVSEPFLSSSYGAQDSRRGWNGGTGSNGVGSGDSRNASAGSWSNGGDGGGAYARGPGGPGGTGSAAGGASAKPTAGYSQHRESTPFRSGIDISFSESNRADTDSSRDGADGSGSATESSALSPLAYDRAQSEHGASHAVYPRVPNSDFRVVGEAMDTYIVVEYRRSIWLIDKHAAHERIHFDALRSSGYQPMSQSLITPVICRQGHDDIAALLDNISLLEKLGFAIESFGDDAVAVRCIPSDIELGDAEPVLSEICAELAHGGTPEHTRRDNIYKSIACKAAIKAGKSSDVREMEALAARVLSGEIAQCPHGRPVAFVLSKASLDRSFKRI